MEQFKEHKKISNQEFETLWNEKYNELVKSAKSSERKDKSYIFPSKTMAKLEAYKKLKTEGRLIEPPLETEMKRLSETLQRYSDRYKAKGEERRILEEKSVLFNERLKGGESAAKILCSYSDYLFSGEQTSFELYIEKTKKLDRGGSRGFGFSETSFRPFFKEIFNSQMTILLPEDLYKQYINIQTWQEAKDFIESKPLHGKKVAEIGGDQTNILRLLDAKVDNLGNLKQSEERITLDNYMKNYKSNYYDLVSTNMVFDQGSGIEITRPEYFEHGIMEYAYLELHSVINMVLKQEGIAIHVGNLGFHVPRKLSYDDEMINWATSLYADGNSNKFWECFRADYEVWMDTRTNFYRKQFGLSAEVYLPRSEINMVEALTVYIKSCDTKITSFQDVYSLVKPNL